MVVESWSRGSAGSALEELNQNANWLRRYMKFKRKIRVIAYLIIILTVCFGGYVFYGLRNRENYYNAQQNFGVEMRQAFDVGDYSRCVALMEKSSKLMQEKTTKKRNLFTSIYESRPAGSGISYFYTTLYPAWDTLENQLSFQVNWFLQEPPEVNPTRRDCLQNRPWMQLGKAMAKSENLYLQLLGLWLTRDDVELAKVLFARIDRGERGFVCHMTTKVIFELEGVSPEDKFNYYLKALVLDYPKLKQPERRMMILEEMQYSKWRAVFYKEDAIKSGMSGSGASEKIIMALNQCWGEEYPEETRYLTNHLDSYISGQENLEREVDAWLETNPH